MKAMKTKINKQTLRQHLTYSWWKYIGSVVLVIFAWNLIYAVTTPRVPPEEKLDFFIYAYGPDEVATEYLEGVRQEQLPDVREINPMYIMPDDSSGIMVLTTHIFAGEGDLFLLPRDNFQSYAAEGLFLALDTEDGLSDLEEECQAHGINLERGWRKNQDLGERHLYGIPTSSLGFLSSWTYSSDEMYLSIRVNSANPDNAAALYRLLIEDALTETAASDIT